MTATSQEPATPFPFGSTEGLTVHPKLAEVRQHTPVLRVAMPYGGEAWLATRYDDVKTVLADPRFSTAAVLGKDVPRSMPQHPDESNILTMDPPEHGRLRKLVAKAFTVRRVEALRPRIQQILDDLTDTMLANGSPADLAAALNWPLPITVICEMLGVPVDGPEPGSASGPTRCWRHQRRRQREPGQPRTPQGLPRRPDRRTTAPAPRTTCSPS